MRFSNYRKQFLKLSLNCLRRMIYALIAFSISILGFELLYVETGFSEESGFSIVDATIQVEPTISVALESISLEKELSGVGEIEHSATFLVVANKSRVDMFIEATDLYLNGQFLNPEVDPIPLDLSSGVSIYPGDAIPVDGEHVADFIVSGNPIQGFPSQRTETLSFDAAGNLTFNYSTVCTVTWVQNNPSKPTGHYYGKIKLTCIVGTP